MLEPQLLLKGQHDLPEALRDEWYDLRAHRLGKRSGAIELALQVIDLCGAHIWEAQAGLRRAFTSALLHQSEGHVELVR